VIATIFAALDGLSAHAMAVVFQRQNAGAQHLPADGCVIKHPY
jgi:hypothetical protein